MNGMYCRPNISNLLSLPPLNDTPPPSYTNSLGSCSTCLVSWLPSFTERTQISLYFPKGQGTESSLHNDSESDLRSYFFPKGQLSPLTFVAKASHHLSLLSRDSITTYSVPSKSRSPFLTLFQKSNHLLLLFKTLIISSYFVLGAHSPTLTSSQKINHQLRQTPSSISKHTLSSQYGFCQRR